LKEIKPPVNIMAGGGFVEEVINKIVNAMDDLTPEQIRKLKNVLVINLSGQYEQKNEICAGLSSWERLVNNYLGCKKLENCFNGTLKNYQRIVRTMYSQIGKDIRDITANDLRLFMARYIEQRKISSRYSETIRLTLCAFFQWCQNEEIIVVNPARKLQRIKIPKKLRKPYTAEERLRLTRAAKNIRDIAIMEVLYSTAARLGEILALNKDDINFVGNKAEIIIYGQKGKAERKVYLSEESVYFLKKYLESRTDDDPALFVSLRKPHKRIDERAVQRMIKDLGERCGIKAHPHKFRRTLLTDMSKRGASIQDIKEYAGHAKIETTMLYVSVNEESVKAAFDRFIS